MWFIVGVCGLLPSCFSQDCELVGRVGVSKLGSGGRGVESGMFPGLGNFCFKNGGASFSVTKTTNPRGRDEEEKIG